VRASYSWPTGSYLLVDILAKKSSSSASEMTIVESR